MTSLVTPNLLELVEAYHAKAITLGELSLCADEGPADQSVCADEISSDVRLKTDIERVGTTVYGLPLYHFRYKTGAERFEGVMAQDVLEVMPDAVMVGEDGYYRVKYGQLGIQMTRA
ncbi:MAG TPA: tail fiber domain-containing protein [Candidatus Sulfotelmatobacter sp.]|nr:tail fiber domain-containing protein [Candidatus Sulfotelmatobacter sp.]